jgi:hypothetical protein
MYQDHLLVAAYSQSISITASTMEIRPVMRVTVPSTLHILSLSPGEQQTTKIHIYHYAAAPRPNRALVKQSVQKTSGVTIKQQQVEQARTPSANYQSLKD